MDTLDDNAIVNAIYILSSVLLILQFNYLIISNVAKLIILKRSIQ